MVTEAEGGDRWYGVSDLADLLLTVGEWGMVSPDMPADRVGRLWFVERVDEVDGPTNAGAAACLRAGEKPPPLG